MALGKSISLVLFILSYGTSFKSPVPLWTLLFSKSPRGQSCHLVPDRNDQWQDDKAQETKTDSSGTSLSVTQLQAQTSLSPPSQAPSSQPRGHSTKGWSDQDDAWNTAGAQTLACLVLQLLVSEAMGNPMCLMWPWSQGWTTGTLSSVSLNKFRSMNANFRNLQAGHLRCKTEMAYAQLEILKNEVHSGHISLQIVLSNETVSEKPLTVILTSMSFKCRWWTLGSCP